MPRKPKLKVVRDRNAAAVISALSQDEQAHLLNLADVALKTKKAETASVGSRTHEQHERLKQELRDALDQVQQQRTTDREDAA